MTHISMDTLPEEDYSKREKYVPTPTVCCEKCEWTDYEYGADGPTGAIATVCRSLKCPCHQKNPMEWRERFDEMFGMRNEEANPRLCPGHCNNIKSFIAETLHEERETLRKKVEMRKAACAHRHAKCGTTVPCIVARTYNQALSDILKLLGGEGDVTK